MYKHRFGAPCLCVILAISCGGTRALGQTIPSWCQTNAVQAHEKLYDQFKSGDTNVPLLRVDVFQGLLRHGIARKDGYLASFSDGQISSHVVPRTLGPTDFARFIEANNALPPSSKGPVPLDSQIHISGLRSNQWFHVIYDIRDYPKQVLEVLRPFDSPWFKAHPAFSSSLTNRATPGSNR
jgi:hypothetical protein